MKRSAGALCYIPEHGPVLELDGRSFCPHEDHNGRPAAHLAGPLAASSPWQDRPTQAIEAIVKEVPTVTTKEAAVELQDAARLDEAAALADSAAPKPGRRPKSQFTAPADDAQALHDRATAPRDRAAERAAKREARGIGKPRLVTAEAPPLQATPAPAVERAPCLCGCGGTPSGKKARFLPGHDARYHAALKRAAAAEAAAPAAQ